MLASLKDGLKFVRRQTGMDALMVLAFGTTLLAVPVTVFLPVIARDVFHQGPKVFTILLCSSGAGSVCGALGVAYLGGRMKHGRPTLLLMVLLGVLATAFAYSRNLVLSCALLFLFSAALIAVLSLTSSLVQLITADQMRGRVMSVFNVAFRGGMPIGNLLTGTLSRSMIASDVLAVNGVLLSLLGLYFLIVNRKVAEL
jgi:predicted MFS family arabinose efflux permease